MSETATGLGHIAMYNVLRMLPIDFVSNLGEKAGHLARASFAAADRRADENWARLRPEEEERAEAATEYAFGQTGRVHWEFATMARLQRAGQPRQTQLILPTGRYVIFSSHSAPDA